MEKNSSTILTCNVPSVIYRYLTHIAIVAKKTFNANFFQEEGNAKFRIRGVSMVKMKPGLYYFAHPYSGKTLQNRIANYELCRKRSAALLLRGYVIFSPIVHSHPIEMVSPEMLKWPHKKRWRFWINIDLAIIEYVRFTGIILAPDWGRSKGCLKEYDWFVSNKGPNGRPHEILLYNRIVGD